MHVIEQNGILPLASRASSTAIDSDVQTNYGAKGIRVAVRLTAGSGAVTVAIIEKDANGQENTLLTSASLSGTGNTYLTVYPTLTAAANTIAQNALSRTFIVRCTGNGTALTYQVGYSLLA